MRELVQLGSIGHRLQGEVSLLRPLWVLFRTGDVLLIDCVLLTWTDLLILKQRGVDSVTRLNKARRTADLRLGKRLCGRSSRKPTRQMPMLGKFGHG